MRRRGLLLGLVLALGLGLAAGAVVMRQSARTSPAEERKEKTVKIVVFTKKLTRGVKLKKQDVNIREWPERLVTKEFVRKIKDAQGRVIITNVVPGEPLLQGKMAEPGSKEGLSTLIESGRRAFAIRVRDDTGVAGFLLPGSRVDVHATLEVEVSTGKGKNKQQISLGSSTKKVRITKTILQDVEVLAAGGTKEAGQKKSRISTKVVTLSLTPEESSRLALSASSGTIWLSMRNPRDRAQESLRAVSIEDVLQERSGSFRSPEESLADGPKIEEKEEKEEKAPAHVVEILQGGQRTEVKF